MPAPLIPRKINMKTLPRAFQIYLIISIIVMIYVLCVELAKNKFMKKGFNKL